MKKRKLKRIGLRDIDMYNRRMRHRKSGGYQQFIDNKEFKQVCGMRLKMRNKADILACKLSCLHMRWLDEE